MADDKKLSELGYISTISFLYGVDDSNISGKLTKAAAIQALNLVTDSPSDGKSYARRDASWSEVSGFTGDTPETITAPWNFVDGLNANGVSIPETAISTGFVGNASVSINAGDAATFDYSIDGAVFVDDTGYQSIPAASGSGVSVTNIGVQPVTYLGINKNGSVIQSPNQFSSLQRRTIAPLATLTHINLTVIQAITVNPIMASDIGGLINDFFYSTGPINISGNAIEPYDTTLKIKRTAGMVFGRGVNYETNPLDPNVKTTAEDSPVSFFTNYRNSGSGVVIGVSDSVDPNRWDNGSGTLVNLGGDDAVAHRVYFYPENGTTIIQYGQAKYNKISDALTNHPTEVFEQRSDLGRSIFLGWLLLENGVTNLTAAYANGSAIFSPSSSAGAGGSSGNHDYAGYSVGTLASPPVGLAINEGWLDTTDSATHPILRVSTVAT